MIILHQMDPIALHLGPLQIHWYGVMYLLAFAACWFLGRIRIRQGRLPGVDEAAYGDLLFYGCSASCSAGGWVTSCSTTCRLTCAIHWRSSRSGKAA